MEVLHPRCAGLDVHSRRVNACVRIAAGRKATAEHREFATTTAGLLELCQRRWKGRHSGQDGDNM